MALSVALALPHPAAAQADSVAQAPAPAPAPAQERYRVHLLTMDRGDQVYEMFGHNALLIEDAQTGQALAWNWGLFNFEDVDFIPRFLRGTMRYSMGPADPDAFLASYQAANREVRAHRVNLSQAQAAELDAFVRWNFQPENRPYVYDYYRDNCSTRLRDALDHVLGGVLRPRFEAVDTGRSYRWYSRRQVQVKGWVDQGLSYLLGMRGDPPISAWEAMFLPVELATYLETVEIEGDDGTLRPLLGPAQVWVPAERPPLPATPPGPSVLLLLAGLAGGGLLVALAGRAAAAERATWARGTLAGAVLAWGLASGALGLLLVAAWFTDHHFIQGNLNLLYTSPLAPLAALLLTGALTAPARAAGGWGRGAAMVAAAVVAGSLIGALTQLVGVADQGNLDVIFLALPMNLGMAAAAWRVHGAGPTFRGLRPLASAPPTGGT
jgi:hypothetical protein